MSGPTKSVSLWKNFNAVMATFAALFLLACLAVVLLAWVSLVRSHDQYRRQAETEAQNLCAVLADNILASYEKIDLAVLGVKDEVERQLRSGGVDVPGLEAFIRCHRKRVPTLFALRTVDAEGFVAYGNDVSPGARINLADRDYFMRLKADPNAGLVFSKPVFGRVQTKWVLMLARRIDRPDGSFGGVVYGAIDLEKLKAHFASLSIGSEGVVSLRDAGLAVIVRQNSARDVTGQTMAAPEFRALAKAGRTSGVFAVVSAVDRVERIYAFVKLQPYGHFLFVGLGRREAFEPWRREFHQTVGFVALFLLLIGVSAWLARRAWQRQRRAEAEREQVILELQGALAEVKVLSGMLPICSRCKKIRDDNGYWNQIEAYVASHSEAQFTHSICPDCLKVLYPDIYAELQTRKMVPGGS